MASRLDELLCFGSVCIKGISCGKADHCVDGCSEVRWVGICSGARSGIPRSEDLRCEDPRSEDPRAGPPRDPPPEPKSQEIL